MPILARPPARPLLRGRVPDGLERFGWRVVMESAQSAAAQMATDTRLAEDAGLAVRFFRWSPPAVSRALKQPQPEWLRSPRWMRARLACVERPTGGGIAFHGSDLSVSVVVPHALRLPLASVMATVCRSAARVCDAYGVEAVPWLGSEPSAITYCLAERSPYALLVHDRKIAGFSLRRYRHSWLIQGSVLVRPFDDRMAAALPRELLEQLQASAMALAEASQEAVTEAELAQRWALHWAAWWEELLVEELGARVMA